MNMQLPWMCDYYAAILVGHIANLAHLSVCLCGLVTFAPKHTENTKLLCTLCAI